MFDKVEVRIPQWADFRPAFQFIVRDFRFPHPCGYVRPSRFYTGVIDLRLFGVDAILHAGYRFGTRKDHKLELLQTGKKSLRTMAAIISAVFDVSPNELLIMRIDYASDLYGLPVEWLHRSLRVKFKRTQNERGDLDYETVGGKKLEYLRFGKAPNCIRAYDKPAECKARWRAILKAVWPETPTFEQTFGFPEDTVLSRIERQAGGGRVPPECSTFAKLYQADGFNPFSNIELVPTTEIPLPDCTHHDPSDAVRILGIDALVRRMGLQNARALLNRDGNGKRLMQPYLDYVNSASERSSLSEKQIYETYRDSARRQIQGGLEMLVDNAKAPSIGYSADEIARAYPRFFPTDRQGWRGKAARAALARAKARDSSAGGTDAMGKS